MADEIPKEIEITEITLSGGKVIPAEKAVCPNCKTLDLNTDFHEQAPGRYLLTCSAGHQ
jgi:hypothetical protein